jgi:hypothetical protein
MTPLDLSKQPPRSPHAELDGVIFLPRSIDKARAHLPGGDRHEYNISGLTTTMLERFGIKPDDFVAAVGSASTDADVVAFVRKSVDKAKTDEWNAFIKAREPRGNADLPEVHQTYTWLKEMPGLRTALDILVEDDKRFYAR